MLRLSSLFVLAALTGCAPPRLPPDSAPQSSPDHNEVNHIVVPPPPEPQVAVAQGVAQKVAQEESDGSEDALVAAGETWKGTYFCGQGDTNLEIDIVQVQNGEVEAIFRFHHPPTGARGAYHLHGVFGPEEGRLSFAAGDWIERPAGYDTVGMTGGVEEHRYQGRIHNQSCGAFSVVRQRGK